MGISIPLITKPRLEYIVARTRILLDAIFVMRLEGFKMDRKLRRKIVNHHQVGDFHKDLYWYVETLEQLNFEAVNACVDYVFGDRLMMPLLRKDNDKATERIQRGWAKYSDSMASEAVQQAASTDLESRLRQHGSDATEYVVFTYAENRMADEAVVAVCSAEASNGFGDYKHNGRSLSRAKRFVYEAVLEELGERHVSEAVPEPLEPYRELFLKLCEDPHMSLLDAYAASKALTA